MGRGAVTRLAHRGVGIRQRLGRWWRWPRHRPTRLIADVRRRAQVVGKSKTAAAFAERCDLERILRAANPWTRNRADPDQFGTLFDRAGLQARNFGLGPPRFALSGLKKSATATRQRDKDEGADQTQIYSARHPRRFDDFI